MKKIKAHHILLGYFGTIIVVNIIIMLLMGSLYDLIRGEENQELISMAFEGIGNFSMPLSYVLPAIIGIIFVQPILKLCQDPPQEAPRNYIRLLNSPLNTALISASGWVVILLAFYVGLLVNRIPLRFNFIWSFTSETLLMAMLIFVISYFMIEGINRRYFIPYFFQKKDLTSVQGIRILSIKGRFFIFFLAVAFIPLFLLSNILYRQAPWLSFKILYVVLPFLVVGLLITQMFSNLYSKSLKNMKNKVEEIQRGGFLNLLQVHSNDELGILEDGLNVMSRELAEKERLHDTFGKMVDPRIRDYLLKGKIDLGGENKNAVILFCDIRDFSSLSEELNPGEVVDLLNRYFQVMSRIIESHQGIINKFLGDAILALFNVPIRCDNPEDKAVLAAMEMVGEIQKMARTERIPLRVGIGIHGGQVLAGNIGSEKRMEYTVIGDAVNLASRLEGVTKELLGDICISEQVFQRLTLRNLPLRSFGLSTVKGRVKPMELFELFPANPSQEINRILAQKNDLSKAIQAYQEGNFPRAVELFTRLYQGNPQDKICRHYLKRSLYYKKNPPEKWEGLLQFRRK